MKLTFHIPYPTIWGETIAICGNTPLLGENNPEQAPTMRYAGGGEWTLSLELPNTLTQLEYHYLVKEYNTPSRNEWGAPHVLQIDSSTTEYHLYDRWQEMPREKAFYTSAFTETIFKRNHPKVKPNDYRTRLTLRLDAPRIEPHQTLIITGNQDALGNWNPAQGVALHTPKLPHWEVELDATAIAFPLEYKFVILDNRNPATPPTWEEGDNRTIERLAIPHGEEVRYTLPPLRNPQEHWRGAGVAIPLFSLRSEKSFGVGDFHDLKEFILWAKETHQRVIQILPINDTTITGNWRDSYPYNANSIYALHPIYLDLAALGSIANATLASHYAEKQQQLNQNSVVDYEAVNRTKESYTRILFAQKGDKCLHSAPFKRFFAANQAWLVPYAAFRYLTAQYQTADFTQWGEYATYTPEKVVVLTQKRTPHYKEIAYHYYIQYQLHKQLSEVHAFARENGIVLKGDIPIGINPQSADAWSDSSLFKMDCQAGAPPDDFSATGQNWGFPTYNWEKMAADNYSWWKARFSNMAQYFDAYRIDHILGFFRIWEIPQHSVQGLLGHFSPAKPYSLEELNAHGFFFDEQRYTTPFIRDNFLEELFGAYTEEVKTNYLSPQGFGSYTLQPHCNTQRKVEALLQGKKDDKSEQIRLGLYHLCNEVLFLEDNTLKHHYHPRIAAHESYSFKALNDYERGLFSRLYEEFFYHRHNQFWQAEATTKLTTLTAATSMLVCGEDLGMIPACVPDVMREQQILSLEIERMPKESNVTFGDPAHYPYLSVCTISTHDMPTLRGWWEEEPELAQKYYNQLLHAEGVAPRNCDTWIAEAMIDRHLQSPAMLTILPLQDWLAMEGELRREDAHAERINIPANPRHYWQYRMHLTVEQLRQATRFNQRIAQKIVASGR